MNAPDAVQVFVYGTLRPPREKTPVEDSRYYLQVAPHVRTSMPATLPNARLYDMGAYPAAVPGEGQVLGELLILEASALPLLDRIEGHPHFYRRGRVTVTTADGPQEAWVYWAPEELPSGGYLLADGDWLRRDREAQPEEDSPGEPGELVDPILHALVKRFAEASSSWLSCVQEDGRAHSSPVWHVWRRGRIYVLTTADAVKTTSISANPGVVLTHPDPINPVILEGWATRAAMRRPLLRPLFRDKYAWDIDESPEYDTVFEIIPTKLMAWGDYGQGRWPGSEVVRVRLS